MVLSSQVANQLTGNDQRFLVGKGNGLVRLDGMNRGRQSCKAHHSGEHDVDGLGFHNLVDGLGTGIDLHVGQVSHQVLECFVVLLVGNDDSGWLELVSLLGKQFYPVIGSQTVDLIEVGVLLDDL